MDENEHHKEVFAYFGLAMYTAQVLEHGIVNALVSCDLIPNQRHKAKSLQDWSLEVDQFMDGHFENTMARLIKSFQKFTITSDELEQSLVASLKMRNLLAHRYFRERADVWFTKEGRSSMIAELQSAKELFDKTDQLITDLIRPLLHRHGLTDERLRTLEEEYLINIVGGVQNKKL